MVVNITTNELNTSSRPTNYTWTFTTSAHQRIRFSFSDFHVSTYHQDHYLEIGDGLIGKDSTRLARFRGHDLPTDVVSVSNSAWLNMCIEHPNETFRVIMSANATSEFGNLLKILIMFLLSFSVNATSDFGNLLKILIMFLFFQNSFSLNELFFITMERKVK